MILTLEICANGVKSAIAAQNGGANRIELCTNLLEGGTTPSYGIIEWCTNNLAIEVWPIIRPRGGDFVYSKEEFETILIDINYAKQVGCTGIVVGILNQQANVDIERCAEIIAMAYPMPVVFHRAFDRCANLESALTQIIDLGFVRVLTSGGKSNAYDGRFTIANLVKQAAGKIEIMPGAGITAGNLVEIAEITKATSFHTTAKSLVNNDPSFASSLITTIDYSHQETDVAKVKELKNILNSLK